MTASAHAAALWVGLNLFVLLILSILVVRQRQKHKVVLGDGGVPELIQAIRAFGNATEYVPAGMAALAMQAVVGAPALAIHITGVLLFAGRVLHGYGLSSSGGASLPRTVGVILTWVAYIFAGAALVFYSIG
ncbi:MAPEG family protein [Phenylobacterium sp.]|uniref:MAPEG family protein n=1 Tax=Phenylobacterium sp. TaxID=1871053 RepID=UPI0035B3D7C0